MTKKLVWLLVFTLLLSTCLLSFAACDDGNENNETTLEMLDTLNGKTPEQSYTALTSQINSATNIEITANQTINMNMSFQSMTVEQSMIQNVISQKNAENLLVMLESQTTGASPVENLMEVWYVDGVCYSHVKATGEKEVKAKATIDLNEFAAQYGGSMDETFPEFEPELLQNLKFTKKDGQYYAEFIVSGEMIDELVGNAIEEMMGVDCQFSEVKYKILFNESGEVTEFENDFTFSFSMNTSGVLVSTTATAKTVATVKFGTVGTITPPTDASSYIDVTGRI